MSVDTVDLSVQIFLPVVISGAAAGGMLLASVAIVDGIKTIFARLK